MGGVKSILAMAGWWILAVVLVWSPASIAKERMGDRTYKLPEGVYIELTKEFYEALKAGDTSSGKTYSNDMSQEYLRQIAVSTKFMVESNLQILRNQEKIIRLLESTLRDKAHK